MAPANISLNSLPEVKCYWLPLVFQRLQHRVSEKPPGERREFLEVLRNCATYCCAEPTQRRARPPAIKTMASDRQAQWIRPMLKSSGIAEPRMDPAIHSGRGHAACEHNFPLVVPERDQ